MFTSTASESSKQALERPGERQAALSAGGRRLNPRMTATEKAKNSPAISPQPIAEQSRTAKITASDIWLRRA